MAKDAIVQLSEIRRQVEAARDFDELKGLRDKSASLATYFKSIGERIEIANAAVEGRLRAERRMGEALASLPGLGEKGGDRKSSDNMSLDDIGVTRKQSSRWQKLASISEDEFSDYVSTCNEESKELTTAGFIRHASAKMKPDNGVKQKDNGSVASLLARLDDSIRKELARWEPGYLSIFSDRLRSLAEEIETHGGLPE